MPLSSDPGLAELSAILPDRALPWISATKRSGASGPTNARQDGTGRRSLDFEINRFEVPCHRARTDPAPAAGQTDRRASPPSCHALPSAKGGWHRQPQGQACGCRARPDETRRVQVQHDFRKIARSRGDAVGVSPHLLICGIPFGGGFVPYLSRDGPAPSAQAGGAARCLGHFDPPPFGLDRPTMAPTPRFAILRQGRSRTYPERAGDPDQGAAISIASRQPWATSRLAASVPGMVAHPVSINKSRRVETEACCNRASRASREGSRAD